MAWGLIERVTGEAEFLGFAVLVDDNVDRLSAFDLLEEVHVLLDLLPGRVGRLVERLKKEEELGDALALQAIA